MELEVRRIYDYALIGDTHTAALVHLDGSVDWLCLPRLDSAAVFARLVGVADNGRWRLDADAPVLERTRRYRGDTMILETELSSASGRIEIVDFMSPQEEHPTLVRLVYGLTGRVRMTMDLRFRFGYGEVIPWGGGPITSRPAGSSASPAVACAPSSRTPATLGVDTGRPGPGPWGSVRPEMGPCRGRRPGAPGMATLLGGRHPDLPVRPAGTVGDHSKRGSEQSSGNDDEGDLPSRHAARDKVVGRRWSCYGRDRGR